MCDEVVLIDDGEIRYSGLVDDCLSSIQKLRVRAENEMLKDYVITEELGMIKTVLAGGERKEIEEKMKEEGIGIIDFEKVRVSDVYTFMRKGGMNCE
jgi:ABC-type multidrug transport system ATPase subunit